MIKREKEKNTVISLLKKFPVVGLIGARQVGKTTLARQVARDVDWQVSIFDLEDPQDLSRLSDPMLALKELRGLIIIDEVQRLPGIFRTIRVLADKSPRRQRFLVLGSASPDLLRQSAESLAGRIVYHKLEGFSIEEVGKKNVERLWIRGGFPRSFVARSLNESIEWRKNFIQTYLERDLPQLGITISSVALRRFWNMLAHYHGQVWNASEFARSFGVADTTVRRYLDVLTSTFLVRQIPAWHENISKRQVKSPKVYITDTGILHTLLNIRDKYDLLSHPKVGASWEGFIIDQVLHLASDEYEHFFWATHSGAELDLLLVKGRKRVGIEVKFTSSPQITRSMKIALADLKLNMLYVIYAGEENYPLSRNIYAISAWNMLDALKL